MKVTASTVGRFHAFDLARQLLKHDHLRCLYTGYPQRKIDPDLRPHSRSFPWLYAPQMGLERYGWPGLANRLTALTCNTFDHWVATHPLESDILVIQSQSGLYTLRRARAHGIKTVCLRGSVHIVRQNEILTEEYRRHGQQTAPVPHWAIDKELAEYDAADLIEVNSLFVYDSFIQQGMPEAKLHLVPQGVDLSLFQPSPKHDDVFRVLFAGTLSLQKGIPYLLEAVADLRLPNFELLLVGAQTDEIQPVLRRHAGHFRYGGVVPRTEMASVYAQASVFILPSIQDGFGAVIMQAMACGVPVIASTNTGGRDVITDGVEGYIIPIRSPQAIHEKILHLYHNPELRDKMAQAALRRVQSVGGWDEYGERSIRAYSRLLK